MSTLSDVDACLGGLGVQHACHSECCCYLLTSQVLSEVMGPIPTYNNSKQNLESEQVAASGGCTHYFHAERL